MTAMAAREAVLRSERSTATPPPLLGNFLPQNSVVHVDYVAHNVRGRELAVCTRVHSRPHSPETLNAHRLQCFGLWGNRAPAAVPCIPVGRRLVFHVLGCQSCFGDGARLGLMGLESLRIMALGSQVLFHSFESLTLLSCKMRHLNRELFRFPCESISILRYCTGHHSAHPQGHGSAVQSYSGQVALCSCVSTGLAVAHLTAYTSIRVLCSFSLRLLSFVPKLH